MTKSKDPSYPDRFRQPEEGVLVPAVPDLPLPRRPVEAPGPPQKAPRPGADNA